MEDSKKLIFVGLLKLAKSSEDKYKNGDFKGALEDKKKVKVILKSQSCDKEVKKIYEEELADIYLSKFDLINDYKKILSDSKRIKIKNYLEKKSIAKYKIGDYESAIKALRRSEKYSLKIKDT